MARSTARRKVQTPSSPTRSATIEPRTKPKTAPTTTPSANRRSLFGSTLRNGAGGGASGLLNADNRERMGPEVLESVVFPLRRGKDVDHDISIIEQNPARRRLSFLS